MKVELFRLEGSDQGTLGALRINGEIFCCTLEPSDEDNQKNISCIPTGNYLCKRVNSPKYGDTFEVTNVPNRTHILVHKGNVEKNTKGCILLGQYWGKLGQNRAVLNSGKTFKKFLEVTKEVDEFNLFIVQV